MKRIVSLILVFCLVPVFGGLPQTDAAGLFSDITDTETQQAAELLYQLKIVSGTGGDKYSPGKTFDRSMLAVIGVRLNGVFDVSAYGGTVRFPDVRASHWAHKWINAANMLGIMKGSTDGNFHPENPMLYGELITVLMKLLGYTDEDVGLNWPQSYISKAEALGISKGMTFTANNPLTRGEASRLIRNFLFLKDKEGKVYVESAFGAAYTDAVLAFDTADGVTVISAGEDSYTYRGTLDASYKGKLASLLVDKDGNVLLIDLDKTVTYRQAIVTEAQSRGLETTGGGYVPVGSSVGVWEWEGTMGEYTAKDFWDEEPVTLVYRGNTLLYIIRDSYENQIGARYVSPVMLRLRTTNGQTYVITEDGMAYRVKGTIDAAMSGRTGKLLVDRDGYAVSFTESKTLTYRSATVKSDIQANGFRDEKGGFISIPGATEVWGEDMQTYAKSYMEIRPGETFLLAYNSAGQLQYLYRSMTRGSGDYKLAILEKQPDPKKDVLVEAFGKEAAGAALYKNGHKAELDMLEKWDVLMYYPNAGVVEASSVRVTAFHKSPRPSPTAPETLEMLGETFELLPEATAKMVNYDIGQRCIFLLSADGRIADVRSSGEVYDTTIGLETGNAVAVGSASLSFEGETYGPYSLMTGRVGHFQGATNDRIYITPIEPKAETRDFNVGSRKLGTTPIAPWCAIYDQVGNAGRAVRLTFEDIPMNRIPADKILYTETSPAGYITAIVLNDVTGDAYTYGYADDREQSGSMLDGGSYTYYEMAVSYNGKAGYLTEWLFAGSFDPPRRGSIVGMSASNALNGDGGTVAGVLSCIKYEGLTRFDFDGNNSVKIKGANVPIAATKVYVPSADDYMLLEDARAYCKTFEVYTDPWGYKVRFIIGR